MLASFPHMVIDGLKIDSLFFYPPPNTHRLSGQQWNMQVFIKRARALQVHTDTHEIVTNVETNKSTKWWDKMANLRAGWIYWTRIGRTRGPAEAWSHVLFKYAITDKYKMLEHDPAVELTTRSCGGGNYSGQLLGLIRPDDLRIIHSVHLSVEQVDWQWCPLNFQSQKIWP